MYSCIPSTWGCCVFIMSVRILIKALSNKIGYQVVLTVHQIDKKIHTLQSEKSLMSIPNVMNFESLYFCGSFLPM